MLTEAAGFRIEVASNFAEGMVLLNASLPALLIADAWLPDGDGLKLVEAARRLGVKALLVSGHPEAIEKAEEVGIPFLAKPFRVAELEQVLRTLVEGADISNRR